MEFILDLPEKLFTPTEVLYLKRYGNKLKSSERIEFKKFEFSPEAKGKIESYQILLQEREALAIEKNIDYLWIKYNKNLFNWGEIYKILNNMNNDEIQTLSAILKLNTCSKEDIIPALISNSEGLFDSSIDKLSYKSILDKIKDKLKIQNEFNSDGDTEKAIAAKVLKDFLLKMTEQQKAAFEKELIEITRKEKGIIYKSGTVFATLTAAQISGFGVYLLASSSLSFLSGAIGLSLPFAAYTTLSTAIGVIIGPAGWIGMGLFTLWKINEVNYNKIIPAVIYLSWLREKYTKEF
ncbi:YaaW family protein [Flavobacterium nackdongense]|uniref:DUF3944 domain-containing protein n=1 Tax=Flavobacterium nackdongense TaxID=2547394 RepID=A0A4P6YI71_9FLAO|nr:YaaW family protein [Flavobacterium nackdongense]QBN20270.1 hypothetical protein E1750_16195 [Flavobacterium nackdongense]